jgi:hypothetical protein
MICLAGCTALSATIKEVLLSANKQQHRLLEPLTRDGARTPRRRVQTLQTKYP